MFGVFKKIIMDNRIINRSVFTGILAFIGDRLGIIYPALILFVFLMILDYISGMLAANKEALEHPLNPQLGWNSKKGLIGIYKKIGYMLTISVAISMDYIIFVFIGEIGLDNKQNTLFGVLVLVWFILNELISILENVGRMGVQLPKFLVKTLTEIRKNVDEKNNLE